MSALALVISTASPSSLLFFGFLFGVVASQLVAFVDALIRARRHG